MKNNYKMTLKTALAVVCCMGLQQFASAQTTETIAVSEDTYVSDQGDNGDTNYGDDVEGRARDTTTSAPRITYYKFPVASTLPSTVDSAILKFYVYAPSSSIPEEILEMHKLVSTWSEDAVTYNTKPATGALISNLTITPVVPGDPYESYTLDITAYMNQVIAAGGTDISIAIKALPSDAGGSGVNVRTGTKENSDQDVAASINVTYTPLSVNDFSANSSAVKVYPNPIKSTFTLNRNFNASDVVEIAVYNILGAKVASFNEAVQPGSWKKDLNAENLKMQSGIYLLKVSSRNNGDSISKIVVE